MNTELLEIKTALKKAEDLLSRLNHREKGDHDVLEALENVREALVQVKEYEDKQSHLEEI